LLDLRLLIVTSVAHGSPKGSVDRGVLELEVPFERANRKCTLTGGDDACHLAVEGS
jgi:hypothetical protein